MIVIITCSLYTSTFTLTLTAYPTANPRNGNPTILRQVDMMLRCKLGNLLGRETGEAEHANLVGDVIPVVRGSERGEMGFELGAHGNDAVGHEFDLAEPEVTRASASERIFHKTPTQNTTTTLPLGAKFRRVEHRRCDTRTTTGRVRVHGAHHNLDLRLHGLLLLGVRAYDGEGTDALAIKALYLRECVTHNGEKYAHAHMSTAYHVLGKRLRQAQAMTIRDKLAHGICILITVAARETLVGHVKEDKVFLLLRVQGSSGVENRM